MITWIAIAALFAASAGPAAPKLPKPRTATALASFPAPAGSDVIASVSPAAILFSATNPDLGLTAGSSSAVMTFIYNGSHKVPWNVTVQASSATFDGCPTIPVSAVTVTCNSVDVTKNGRGACSGPFQLSTSPVVAASGTESNPSAQYTITFSYTLADNWRQIAKLTPSCSLTLTYTAIIP